jgi:hypothetical protein
LDFNYSRLDFVATGKCLFTSIDDRTLLL